MNKNSKFEKFAFFKKKTISFKVMKTIRNQLKNPQFYNYQLF